MHSTVTVELNTDCTLSCILLYCNNVACILHNCEHELVYKQTLENEKPKTENWLKSTLKRNLKKRKHWVTKEFFVLFLCFCVFFSSHQDHYTNQLHLFPKFYESTLMKLKLLCKVPEWVLHIQCQMKRHLKWKKSIRLCWRWSSRSIQSLSRFYISIWSNYRNLVATLLYTLRVLLIIRGYNACCRPNHTTQLIAHWTSYRTIVSCAHSHSHERTRKRTN